MNPRLFHDRIDGQEVELLPLRTNSGMTAWITNYGARLVSWLHPGRDGKPTDVVLGFDSLRAYREGPELFFGATIGRYANRIAAGRFELDGREYQLSLNGGPHHLHGGEGGFHKRVWRIVERRENAVEMVLDSADGDEGYPGNLQVRLRYSLGEEGSLEMRYHAESDARTPLNLTNHSYFNLAGAGENDILGHQVRIHASRFNPIAKDLIPTGEMASVKGTPFDLGELSTIGEKLATEDSQLSNGRGFDHNFVLEGKGLREAAFLLEPGSGRFLEVHTDQPGMQFYTGNFLDGSVPGKRGQWYPYRSAFCCETQHFPDSLNHPNFPSTILEAGEIFRSTTIFRLGLLS